jgi:hypothetical protein
MNNWQTFILTIAKLAAGVTLCFTGHCDFGMLLMGAGIYSSGKNGFSVTTTPPSFPPEVK